MNVGNTLGHIKGASDVTTFRRNRKPSTDPTSDRFRFYAEMLKIWRKYRNFEPDNEAAIRKEPLWFNDHLGTVHIHLNWRGWEKQGICTVRDLCHQSEDRLLSHTEIMEKFSVPCSFLEALSLRLAVPMRWKKSLSKNWQCQDPGTDTVEIKLDQDPPKDIANVTMKAMYGNIVKGKKKSNAALEKWKKGDDSIQLTNQMEWSLACERIYLSTRETKVQSFQFKLLHRIVPCRVYLKQIRIADSNECSFCGQRDSIIHFVFQCGIVATFWSGVCKWFRQADEVYLDHLSPEEFLFGIAKECHHSTIINNILLLIKYYIHRQKLFYKGKLETLQWLQEF